MRCLCSLMDGPRGCGLLRGVCAAHDSHCASEALRTEEPPVPMFKVYVGNLDPRTTVDSLKPYFEPFGDAVDEIVLALDAEGKPRGFAIVLFRDPQRGQLAIETLTGKKINGREVQINESVKKSKRTPPPTRAPRNSPLGPRAFQPRPGFGPRAGGTGFGPRAGGRADARPGAPGAGRPSGLGAGGVVRNPRRAGAGPASAGGGSSMTGPSSGATGSPGSPSRPLGGGSRPLGGSAGTSRPLGGSRPLGSSGGVAPRTAGGGGMSPSGSRPLGHASVPGRPAGSTPGTVRPAARPLPVQPPPGAAGPSDQAGAADAAPPATARPKAVRKKPPADPTGGGQ
jgi:hypothetical protein